MELVKTYRPLATIFGHSPCTKRTAKICFGLIAAVFLLQFYYVRELVFMEAVVARGFAVVALIGALYALGYIAALWLRKLGSGLKALGAHVSVKQPTRRQLDSPATPKQELPNVCSWRWVNQAILDVLEHGEAAEDAESWLLSKDFELSHCGLTRALKIWR